MSGGLAEGTIFAGRYRVVRVIAHGGMGAVYEVIHLETERRRALKVMLPHVLQSHELRERFQREAKVAAHVESDYIVDVFDAGFDEETRMPFLVMELLRGEELGKRLKRYRRLPPADVVSYLHQTALALDKTHRASIVHRDLKPDNLFLTERDDGPARIKVLDFGIAKVVADSTTQGGATQSIGTPTYMAPEQLNPHARLSGATDRYALAMVAYTLLVGAPYWGEEARGGNALALAMVTVYGPREPASARAARRGMTLPPSFDAWFARAAHVDPAQRFATSVEMVAALAEALGLSATSPARGASLSLSNVNELPYGTGFGAPHGAATPPGVPSASGPLPTPAGPLPTPAGPLPTPPGLAPVAPVTGPALTATRVEPPPSKSRGGLVVLIGAGATIALAAVGAVVVLSTHGAATGPGTTGATASAEPAVTAPLTASAVASAAPAVPTVTAAAEAPALTASAAPRAEPTPAATPKPEAKAPAGGVPATTAAAPAKGPAVDPKRKKMWGRD